MKDRLPVTVQLFLEEQRRQAFKLNAFRMSQNQGKPANSTNNVSFAELMRMLKGE